MSDGGHDRSLRFKRLSECAETLAKGEPLDADDAIWLSGILQSLCNGEDVRLSFFEKTGRGRPAAPDRWEFWMTVEALVIAASTGNKGKSLWARLAQRWDCSDGSVKNAISRNRAAATAYIAGIGPEEAMKVARTEELRKHNNSRN